MKEIKWPHQKRLKKEKQVKVLSPSASVAIVYNGNSNSALKMFFLIRLMILLREEHLGFSINKTREAQAPQSETKQSEEKVLLGRKG